jgi:hypothetical protein
MSDFTFDPRAQRYRYASGVGKGQFVARAAIENLRKTYITQQIDLAGKITEDLINNRVSLKEWQLGIAQAIKTSYVNQWMIARGGLDKITNRDKGLLGNKLRVQYAYLSGFATSISNGELSEAQIRARVNQYFAGLNALNQDARRESHAIAGKRFEQSILQPGESCQSCIAESLKGVQPIGSLVPIGERTCKNGCNCYYIFYDTEPNSNHSEILLDASGRSFGWVG